MIIFRWAMLGTGMASRNLLLGLRNSEFDAHVTAVTSGAKMNSERFARDFKVPHVSESYEAACAWSEADAVCIATPPGVHEIYALMSIAARKPAPLKKPVDMDATSTNQIASAARSTTVFCMEAMWTRFPPPVRHVKQIVDNGAIEEIHAFVGNFSIAIQSGTWTDIFKAESVSGTLMYRGVYPLSLAGLVMGPVTEAHTVAAFGETGVDEDTIVTCRHENGISTLQTSLRTNAANDFHTMATTRVIHVGSPVYSPSRLHYRPVESQGSPGLGNPHKDSIRESGLVQGLIRWVQGPIHLMRGRGGRMMTRHFTSNGYHYEADELMRSVQAAGQIESKTLSLDDSFIVMEALDKAAPPGPSPNSRCKA